MKRFEPRTEKLIEALRLGVGADTIDVRGELGLRGEADDVDVARSLVQILSACAVAGELADGWAQDPAAEKRDTPVEEDPKQGRLSLDTSLLGQLGGDGGFAVDELDDLTTLFAVLRAGRLPQRLAALRRITAHLETRSLKGDEQKAVAHRLYTLRDVELDYDRGLATRFLSGRRAAKLEREAWEKLVGQLKSGIVEFWEAASTDEPIAALPREERAILFLRFRDAPDVVAAHVGALVEESLDSSLDLVLSLRHACDPRLVPSLRAALDGGNPQIALEAARALRRVEDPRVAPALAAAYERSPRDRFRAIVGGALADHGDARALSYVRDLLDREDVPTLLAALEALTSLGQVEDAERVIPLLTHSDSAVVREAVRTLARISDGRALRHLVSLASEIGARNSALRGEIEDARDAIVARMELRGEESPDDTGALLAIREEVKPQLGGKRFAAWRSFVIGQIWATLGATQAALRRLERASNLRPGWVSPFVVMGLMHTRAGRHSQALAAFRRAVEADRPRVERNPLAVRALARSFIARAEQVEEEGRPDVARGLLTEALSLDLRWASGPQRFELERRRDTLQRRKLPA